MKHMHAAAGNNDGGHAQYCKLHKFTFKLVGMSMTHHL